MDLSIIPEVVGESIDGATRAAAAIGKAVMPAQIRNMYDAVGKQMPNVWNNAVDRKEQQFNDQDTSGKLSDVADLATMVPVVGYGGALVKGASIANKGKKVKRTYEAEQKLRKMRTTQALSENKRAIRLAKSEAHLTKDARIRKALHTMKSNKPKNSRKDYVEALDPVWDANQLTTKQMRAQVAALRKISKGIKKGARVAQQHSKSGREAAKYAAQAKQKTRPSRSAIAGAVYQLSKKKTKR